MIEIQTGAEYKVKFRGRKQSQRVWVRRIFSTFGMDAEGNVQRDGIPCLVYEVCRMRNQPGPEHFRSVSDIVEISVEWSPEMSA